MKFQLHKKILSHLWTTFWRLCFWPMPLWTISVSLFNWRSSSKIHGELLGMFWKFLKIKNLFFSKFSNNLKSQNLLFHLDSAEFWAMLVLLCSSESGKKLLTKRMTKKVYWRNWMRNWPKKLSANSVCLVCLFWFDSCFLKRSSDSLWIRQIW